MTKLTAPQSRAQHFIAQFGPVTKADLLKAGLDMRAVKKLEAGGLITISQEGKTFLYKTAYLEAPAAEPSFDVEKFVEESPVSVARPAVTKVSARSKKAKREPGLCRCGCKQLAARNFVVGHDGQLHGQVSFALKKALRPAFQVETVEYLRSAKWMTEEKITALGLN